MKETRPDTCGLRLLEMTPALPLEEKERLLDGIAVLDAEVFGSSKWGREAFSENTENDYDDLVAAVCGENPVGYALLRSFDDAELIMIAVSPGLRGQGIGARLLERLIQKAKERGAGSIFLEVRASNAPAIRLYEGAGFETAGVRRGYYHDPAEDAVIMRLPVHEGQDGGK